MMLLLVAGAAALVGPGARPPRAVVCRGATYDYCVQALGCTAQEATKAEGALLPNIAESMTRTQIDCVCDWLQSSLDLSDAHGHHHHDHDAGRHDHHPDVVAPWDREDHRL